MWNVLVVDDSASSLALLERIIVRLGHRPLLADCGTRALSICAIESPDMMLLDVVMPDIDGWELATRLRQMDHLRDVPIVFQSSIESTEEIERCRASGAADVVPKPLREARVEAMLTSLLGRSRAGPTLSMPAPPRTDAACANLALAC